MIFVKIIYRFIIKIKFHFDSFAVSLILNLRGIRHGKILSHGFPYIAGKRVVIGNNLRINNTLRSNPIGYAHRSVIVTWHDGNIQIGNNVGMSHVTIVSAKEIIIEDNVMIGGGVNIYDTDFHSIDYRLRGTEEDTINAVTAPVHICKNVFIGTQATVLKGVTIGENSIVGACSLVTKDIPPNEVWGGVPAKFIRKIEIT